MKTLKYLEGLPESNIETQGVSAVGKMVPVDLRQGCHKPSLCEKTVSMKSIGDVL